MPLNKSKYKIVFIGAGNVATQMALSLKKAKHNILQIVSKHKSSGNSLAKLLKCDYTTFIEKIDMSADIYIIAVKDDAIIKVVKQLKLKDKIVVHTSGSVEMNLLKFVSKNYGVFYPLQTFSKKNKANFKFVPICLEANNSYTFKILEQLAKSISNNVKKINSEQRKTIHLAAVFACNFCNHLYAIASTILEASDLSLDILKPLIEETANKINSSNPSKIQTGPAIRGDKKTMNNHLKMLTKEKNLQNIYELMSKSIIDSVKHKLVN